MDLLLDNNFEPTRTVLSAVGFDEEGGAEESYGARCLAEYILRVYGEGGVEMIVGLVLKQYELLADCIGSLTKVLLDFKSNSGLSLRCPLQLKRVMLMSL